MKERLIKLIIACNEELCDVATHKSMSPSSSVEEIVEYVIKKIQRQEALD